MWKTWIKFPEILCISFIQFISISLCKLVSEIIKEQSLSFIGLRNLRAVSILKGLLNTRGCVDTL